MQIRKLLTDFNISHGLQQKLGMGGVCELQKMEEFFYGSRFGHYRNKFDGFEGEVLYTTNPFESGSVTGLGGFQLRNQYTNGGEVWIRLGAGVGYG